ncbi:hypothetical protein PANDA_002601, partial [Ailuropoda melanoleuca]
MKTMATRKRCKLSRTSPEFENVIKRLLCVRTFHTRIGGDLTPGIINRGRPANAEQMGLHSNANHFNIFP